MCSMVNEITILGSNGTKGAEGGTSAFWLDAHNVIDAGNLLRPMKEAVAEIETIWLTHSHLDHIVDIAYILDSYFSKRKKSLKLRGLPETLSAIKNHFLNDIIWPDFSKIALVNSDAMALVYEPIVLGEIYSLADGSTIMAFETDHTVESCGYMVTKEKSSLIITADTYDLNVMIDLVHQTESVTALVVECSFPSHMGDLAKVSRHLTPKLLFEALKPLEQERLKLYINHIKPLYEEMISSEIDQYKGAWEVEILKDGEKINF